MTSRKDENTPSSRIEVDNIVKTAKGVYYFQMKYKAGDWGFRVEVPHPPKKEAFANAIFRAARSARLLLPALAVAMRKKRLPSESSTAQVQHAPPAFAEFLYVLLAPKQSAEGQLGDFRELYARDFDRYGSRRAKLLYWGHVLRSVGPALWARIKAVGLWAFVIDWGRRKIGL
jgi:hypothetical protein